MPYKEKHKYFQCSLFRNCSRMLLLLLIRWFCNSLWLMHIHVKPENCSCKRFEWTDTLWKSIPNYFVDRLVGRRCGRWGWTPAIQVIHIRHNQFTPLLAHSLVLDTVCRSAKFFYVFRCWSDSWLAFWIWNKKKKSKNYLLLFTGLSEMNWKCPSSS